MLIGTVVGSIWATQKSQTLNSYKLLEVSVADRGEEKIFVAADTLGAGMGERVILVGGSGARISEQPSNIPLDLTIIAIIDDNNNDETRNIKRKE